MIEVFWFVLSLSAIGVILSSLFGFLGRLWWVFDLFSHFRVQYFFLLVLFALLFLAGGRFGEAAISAAFVLLNLAQILPFYRKAPSSAVPRSVVSASPKPRNTSQDQADLDVIQELSTAQSGERNDLPGRPVRVLLANVLQCNREFARVRDLIRSADPDIILLIEINHTWVKELQPVVVAYPNSLTSLREDNYGLGLFSKLPFTSNGPVQFGMAKVPSILACVHLDGQTFTVIGTHPPPPRRPWLAQQRDTQLKEIARHVAAHPGPSLVLGDFNITSWSPHFKEMLRLGRLKDSRQGFGLQPSWPVDRPALIVPIDHILVTEGIHIHRRWRGPFTGSDHYPVLLEFSLCPSPSIK